MAIGSQVGRAAHGLSGNGYFPPPSGATTEIKLGKGTVIELPRLPDPGPGTGVR